MDGLGHTANDNNNKGPFPPFRQGAAVAFFPISEPPGFLGLFAVGQAPNMGSDFPNFQDPSITTARRHRRRLSVSAQSMLCAGARNRGMLPRHSIQCFRVRWFTETWILAVDKSDERRD